MQNQIASLKGYHLDILRYLQEEKPQTSEVLHFIGALLHSVLDGIKLTSKEREIYLEIYNTIIRKKIFEAEIVDEPANIWQPELAIV